MTNATIKREFNPGRSPLLGIAAVIATALTMGAAVLLPAQHAPPAPFAAVQPDEQLAPTQVVNLPAVDVVGTRPTKSADNNRGNVPVVFKEKG